jgi:23S rRNA pseudouridine1911/1915/1917 synthase
MARFKVTKKHIGERADVFVASKYPEFTRSALEQLFERRLVTSDSEELKAGQKLKLGQSVAVDDNLLRQKPVEIDLPVIYEDGSVIVIDKPAGVLTHAKGALNTEATVANFISTKLDHKPRSNRDGIVHRLDRATSGVIITAKNDDALKQLQKQFSQRKTKKIYLAVVDGQPESEQAIIDVPIERNPKKPQTFKTGLKGKPAQTEYKVVKTVSKNNKTYSLLELKPRTGRTHQLRVHLNYINTPVVGDNIYGKAGERMYLHAKSLEITLPGGERKTFVADPPAYFQEFING